MDPWAYFGLNPKEIRIQGAVAYVPIADGRTGGRRSVQQSERWVQRMLSPSAVVPEEERKEERRGTRGAIREFSDASRKRLERALRKMRWGNGAIFVTLTFAKPVNERAAKKHLARFLQWLRNRYPGGYYAWKMEYQKRGVVHFHLVLTWLTRNPPWFSKDAVFKEWGQGFIKILFVRDKGLLRYLCKYVAKGVGAGSAAGGSAEGTGAGEGPPVREGIAGADGGEPSRLDLKSISPDSDSAGWVGRFWGISRGWPKAPIILASALPEALFKQFYARVEWFLIWLMTLSERWAGTYQVTLPFFAS